MAKTVAAWQVTCHAATLIALFLRDFSRGVAERGRQPATAFIALFLRGLRRGVAGAWQVGVPPCPLRCRYSVQGGLPSRGCREQDRQKIFVGLGGSKNTTPPVRSS